MKVSVDLTSPGIMRVTLGMNLGSRVGISVVGLFFFALGTLFLFSSLPHTEFLRIERSLDEITCTRGQALAGEWVLFEERRTMQPDARATFEWITDEAETEYRMMIQGSGGDLSFGKTQSSFEVARSVTREINEFLERPSGAHYEWTEEVWWWFLSPFGLIGWLVGLSALALGNYRERWVFDRITGTAARITWAILPVRHTQWLISDLVGCKTITREDADGDVRVNIALLHRSGADIAMSSVSRSQPRPERLEEAAARINAFLLARSR